MSLYDYKASLQISADDPPFAALIMAALRKADTRNFVLLEAAFPEIVREVQARYEAAGGILASDHLPGVTS